MFVYYRFRLHPDLDLRKVADRCPFHYTGADFYALCSDSMLKAMTRVADAIETKVKKLNEENRPDLPQPVTAQYYLSHLAVPDDTVVQVEEVDFVKALEELIPSVSATELAHYSRVREKFEKPEDPVVEEEQQEDQGDDAVNSFIQRAIDEAKRQEEAKKQEEEDKVKVAVKDRKGKGKQRA
jgi:peroxin-6